MAKVSVEYIKPNPKPIVVHRQSSHARQAAKKIGLNIPTPADSLPEEEQEIADIA